MMVGGHPCCSPIEKKLIFRENSRNLNKIQLLAEKQDGGQYHSQNVHFIN
jgi:hypothetical protein